MANWKAGEAETCTFEIRKGTYGGFVVVCREDGVVLFSASEKSKAEEYLASLGTR